MRIKDKIYDWAVHKDERVGHEYEQYVREHIEEHYSNRIKHLCMLIRLKWHYQIKKKETPYIYQIGTDQPNVFKKEGKGAYQFGSESELIKRRTIHYVAKEMLRYDLISFDIFDTLLFRPFLKPRDALMLLDDVFDIYGFYAIRIEAENRAREKKEALQGTREVSIEEIYLEVARMTGIEPSVGIQKEIELEQDIAYVNPYMMRLFRLLKTAGKRIILISDMYLSADILDGILKKNGIYGYEKIYVSCDYKANKTVGDLYDLIIRKEGVETRKWMHIGDNKKSDIEMAERKGISTFYYASPNAVGIKYRASNHGMGTLVGSAYSGVVNNHLHNGIKKYSPIYEYGYIYGGLYVYGYCNWIHNYVIKNQIDKIFFFARDGYVLKRVYNSLFPEDSTEYIYSSRIADSFLSFDREMWNFFLRNVRAKANKGYTLKSIFESFGLEYLTSSLDEYELCEDTIVSSNSLVKIEDYIFFKKNEISEGLRNNSKGYRDYLYQNFEGINSAVLVDVGWQGTTLLGMKRFINNDMGNNCKIHCLMAASATSNEIVTQTFLLKEELRTYIFSQFYNRDLYLFHRKTYGGEVLSFLFELFTQAPMPTFSIIDSNGRWKFGDPEVENYDIYREIHRGIMDFCTEYHRLVGSYDALKNIPGRDAYIPFKWLTKRPEFIKNILGDIKYMKVTGGKIDQRNADTIDSLSKFI